MVGINGRGEYGGAGGGEEASQDGDRLLQEEGDLSATSAKADL